MKINIDTMPAVGGYCLCNWGGLEVLALDDEKAFTCFNYGSGRKDARHTKIHYSQGGRAYIVRYNTRYYLDTITRY